MRIGIVSAQSNGEIVDKLVTGTKKSLMKQGIPAKDVVHVCVRRPYDLSFAAKTLQRSDSALSAIMCIGCLIREEEGFETHQFAYESHAVARGIMGLNTGKSKIPVVCAVLTCVSPEQAHVFIGHGGNVEEDHGSEWAKTALELAHLSQELEA